MVVVEVGVLVVLVELLTPSQSWVALCYRTKNTLASTAGNRKGVQFNERSAKKYDKSKLASIAGLYQK